MRSITALRLVTLCITLPYSTCSNRLFTPNQTLRQNPTWLCRGQFRIIDITGPVVWSWVVEFPVFPMVSSLPGDKLERDVDCDDPKSWAGRNLSHQGSLWRLLCPAAGAQGALKSKWMAAFMLQRWIWCWLSLTVCFLTTNSQSGPFAELSTVCRTVLLNQYRSWDRAVLIFNTSPAAYQYMRMIFSTVALPMVSYS